MEWFYFDGTGDVSDPTNYNVTSVPTNCFISSNQTLCGIRAHRQLINGVPRPIITSQLQANIFASILTMVESYDVLLKPY